MRISDWSSDVCSSDLPAVRGGPRRARRRLAHLRQFVVGRQRSGGTRTILVQLDQPAFGHEIPLFVAGLVQADDAAIGLPVECARSEEHTSELQSLMRISYAVFCLKKKKKNIVPSTEYRQ